MAAGGLNMLDLIKGDPPIRVTLEDIGEGLSGDYDPDDPEDIELLRFTVSRWVEDEEMDGGGYYLEIDDASYCTMLPVSAPISIQSAALGVIMEKVYEPASKGYSIKKACEALSWIDESCAIPMGLAPVKQ